MRNCMIWTYDNYFFQPSEGATGKTMTLNYLLPVNTKVPFFSVAVQLYRCLTWGNLDSDCQDIDFT